MICRFVVFWVKGQNHRTCFTINATVSMDNKKKKADSWESFEFGYGES